MSENKPVVQTFKISPEVKKLYQHTVKQYGLRSQYFIEQAIVHEARAVAENSLAAEYARAVRESKTAVDFEEAAKRFGLEKEFAAKNKKPKKASK